MSRAKAAISKDSERSYLARSAGLPNTTIHEKDEEEMDNFGVTSWIVFSKPNKLETKISGHGFLLFGPAWRMVRATTL